VLALLILGHSVQDLLSLITTGGRPAALHLILTSSLRGNSGSSRAFPVFFFRGIVALFVGVAVFLREYRNLEGRFSPFSLFGAWKLFQFFRDIAVSLGGGGEGCSLLREAQILERAFHLILRML
jgi:hypothetical protein